MTLIKNQEALSLNYVPDILPCREKEIDELSSKLKNPSYKVIITGGTGTGKTTYVFKSINKLKDVKIVYLNCSEYTTYILIGKKL